MNTSIHRRASALFALSAFSAAAFAHITLPPGGATAGSDYDAAFRVGHACAGAQATTGVTVRIPAGFTMQKAEPRAGWALSATATSVSWRAATAANALPTTERAEFVVRGRLTATPGPLWFKVLQSCDKGSADWAEVPASAADKPALPAVRLDVLAVGTAPVDVRDAWVRMAVRGQSGTGAFMTLSAPSGARLVGVSTPVAGVAQVHEMKMTGDVMRMRAVEGGLDLPPRQAVALKPSGYHVMLMELKQPLTVGETVPMALEFVDREGRKSVAHLQLPVLAAAATADDSASAAHHH